VGKLSFVGMGFRHQLAGNVKFKVIAIRTDNRLVNPIDSSPRAQRNAGSSTTLVLEGTTLRLIFGGSSFFA